jgi:uncharacterized protein YabN with tetrapyrrole methylase and pyrophosphatase domain
MDGVSRHLPSLLYAHKLYRKAASAGLTFGTADEARARAESALRGLAAGAGAGARAGGPSAADEAERRLGEALAAIVYLARLAGVDGESALRGWAGRFKDRFQRLEALAVQRGETVESIPPSDVATLWEQTL